MAEKFGVDFVFKPKVDRKSASDLNKYLAQIQRDFAALNRETEFNIQGLTSLSKTVERFSKNLPNAVRAPLQELIDLGKELEKVNKKAQDLKGKRRAAGSSKERREIDKELVETAKAIEVLNRQITAQKGKYKQQIEAVDKFVKELKHASQYGVREFTKEIQKAGSSAFGSFRRGDVFGGLRSIGEGYKSGSKLSEGAKAKVALSKVPTAEGGIDPASVGLLTKAIAGLGSSAAIIAGLATSIAGLVGIIVVASDHQAKLNKTILAGTGTVNDFYTNSNKYRKSVDELRNAAIESDWSFRRFGFGAEGALKIVNAYAQTSTGSLNKTAQAFGQLGGSVDQGMKEFVYSAVSYGKALGMEAEEVASMMGNFQTEVGYGANQVQQVMGNIVQAAATANMPVSKFMDIFRSVNPHVELFINRIEELTGAIAMLSKNMRPEDVKKFMNAFGKGLEDESFQSRLHKVLRAGVGKTSKILEVGFNKKVEVMAAGLPGELGGKFSKAFKGPQKDFEKFLTQAKAAGVSGTQIGEMTKLYHAEKARQKGDPLMMATAVKGAGMTEQIQLLKAQRKTITGGTGRIEGLDEHVLEKMGYSQEQQNAFNSFVAATSQMVTAVETYGTTGSKSADAQLKAIIASRGMIKDAQGKAKTADQITPEDLGSLAGHQDFEELIQQAYEQAQLTKKTAPTALDLATTQANATLSITDMLQNVIGYLLEKIFKVLNDIVSPAIEGIWNWMTGSKEEKQRTKDVEEYRKGFKGWDTGVRLSEEAGGGTIGAAQLEAQMDLAAKAVQAGISSGQSGVAATGISKLIDKEALETIDPKLLAELINARGGANVGGGSQTTGGESLKAVEEFKKLLKEQGKEKALQFLESSVRGGSETLLMEIAQNAAGRGYVSEEAVKAGGDYRRAGTVAPGQTYKTEQQTVDEDTVTELRELGKRSGPDKEALVKAVLDRVGASEETREAINKKYFSGNLQQEAIKGPGVVAKALAPAKSDKVQKEETNKLIRSGEKESSDAVSATEDVYNKTNDVLSLLKAGIRFEQSFLTTKYYNVIKKATLESFRTSLLEFAVLSARMQSDEGFAKTFAGAGYDIWSLAQSDPANAMRLLAEANTGGGDINSKIKEGLEGTKQTGGDVYTTGLYQLHRGETVLSPGEVARRGEGGNVVNNVSLVINGANMTPQQFKNEVYAVLSDLERRS